MAARAQIGFHAAYNEKSGQETGWGNALVGAYLNKIGLPYSAVRYITETPPDSIKWLSISDAEKHGIDVTLVNPASTMPPASTELSTAIPQGTPLTAPPQASPSGGGGVPPCMAEFAKLREDVQKKGLAAKAAGERKVSREEMCKHITAFNVAELKWVKFTESNVSSCGISAQVVQQIKQVHDRTEQTREKICAVGPAAGDAPR